MASSALDEYAVRIGFFTDRFASPQTAPVDGVYFQSQFSVDSDDGFDFVSAKSGGSTTRVQWIKANEADPLTGILDTEADTWYELMITINADGTQLRCFDMPMVSSSWANITTSGSIPSPTTPLWPQIQLVNVAGATGVTMDIDHFYVTSAPNGIY